MNKEEFFDDNIVDTTKKKRVRLKKGHQFYVDGKELREELRNYMNSSSIPSERIVSEKLGNFLMLIAKKFASKANFNGYSWKDEMISSAVFRILTRLDKIDLDSPKSNPFAYITKTYLHCFLSVIKSEKLNLEKKRELQRVLHAQFETTEGISRPLRVNEADENDEDYFDDTKDFELNSNYEEEEEFNTEYGELEE